jgi:hypothetical protein
MEPTKGKLTNKDGGQVLKFSMNPNSYQLTRGFDFAVEPRLGHGHPVVAYRSAGAAQLSFSLRFHKDTDKDFSPDDVMKFLKALGTINEATRSAPALEFNMGSFIFTGYASQVTLQVTQFDGQGNTLAMGLDLTLLSTGEPDNA